MDSGASSHMTNQKEFLLNYCEFATPEKVGVGDGRVVEAVGMGNIRLNMSFKVSQSKQATMYNVLHVPKLACNLFSVRAAASKGDIVKFGRTRCWIRRRDGKLLGMGSLANKLYQLDCEPVTMEHASVAEQQPNDVDLWHQRLGHLSGQRLAAISRNETVTGINIPNTAKLSFCEGCVEGKMHRQPFKPVGEIRSSRKLQLIHSDVCGPMQTESIGGHKYFVTFIDDYSRCCAVYYLKRKSEVFEKFKEFEVSAVNECGQKIGTLRTDNGGEFVSKEFDAYLASKGIRHELTIAHTPQQNGVAERMNRTLLESSRAMLCHAGLPNHYWAEAVGTAAHLRNRVVTSAIKEAKTPYEKWYGRKPYVGHLKVFGCVAYAHVPDCLRQKLDKKASKLRFVGYCTRSKGYRLFDEKTKKLIMSRDVTFNETNFDLAKAEAEQTEVVDIDPESGQPEEEPVNEQQVQEPRRSGRQHRPPSRYVMEYADTATVDHVAYKACEIMEPRTIEDAFASDHAKEWKAAADSEYESLMKNETWELVELPQDREAIGCKWVFKVKYTSNGEVERFKGRLVAKGYAQKHGIDYEETFSPVVRFSSIRALLAFGVQENMLIHQMDVVTAFLNGELSEEIYMQQPDGYVVPGKENLVCKLKKSLYGLKQSPRCWYNAFHTFIESIGFRQSAADPCVYIRLGDTTTIVAVYVDDLILLSRTTPEMQEVKKRLTERFMMKDMGKLHYCLGISICHDEDNHCILLQQKQFFFFSSYLHTK